MAEKVEIRSKTAGQFLCYKLDVGSELIEPSHMNTGHGTSVTCHKLFQHNKARRYDLNANAKTDIKDVVNILKAYSIANKDVEFRLMCFNSSNVIEKTFAKPAFDNQTSNLREIFGHKISESFEPFHFSNELFT